MKHLASILVFAFTLLMSVTTANAQGYGADPQLAYDHCREFTLQGDDAYRSGSFGAAKFDYEQALSCNISCKDRQYISDRELNHKIDDCVYAMNHHNKTREQVHEELQQLQYQCQQAQAQRYQAHQSEVAEAVAGTIVLGAVAGAIASSAHHHGPHHDFGPRHDFGPHHDFHHGPHHDFHHDGPHHHHFPF